MLVAALLLGSFATVNRVSAQTTDTLAVRDTTFISLGDLLKTYGLNRRHVEDTLVFQEYLDDWDTSFVAKASYCQSLSRAVIRMQGSLAEICIERDGRMWYDTLVCISDYYEYCGRLAIFANLLQHDYAYYRRQEKLRLEAIQRAERRKEQEAQREKDSEQMRLKQRIALLHESIETRCLASSEDDKEKVKELKNVRYCYLPVYYKYDLSSVRATDASMAKLQELLWFQQQVLDSILGPYCFANRIGEFPERFRERCGKPHIDVYKSYQRQFHSSGVPVDFNTLEGYKSYVSRCQSILRVQEQYLSVVEKREELQSKALYLQDRCARSHKDVALSYKAMQNELDLVPSFVLESDGRHFLDQMDEHLVVVRQYIEAVERLDKIALKGDTIQSRAQKSLADIAVSYRKLVAATNFVPNFRTPKGATFYNQGLDDFEELQWAYNEAIDLRKTIARQDDTITHAKNAPSGFSSMYKLVYKAHTLTPSFTGISQASVFLKGLEELVDQQRYFIEIARNGDVIARNSNSVKVRSKDLPHVAKAYAKLIEPFSLELTATTAAGLQKYLDQQNAFLDLQRHVLQVVEDPSRSAVANAQLKGEKDMGRIRLSFGIQD